MAECFRIHAADNVATLLGDASLGPIVVRGSAERHTIMGRQPIELGHKVALCDIPANTAIVKYGVTIGKAAKAILEGEWVHLHNCSSCVDERSSGFDVRTGLSGNIAYE